MLGLSGAMLSLVYLGVVQAESKMYRPYVCLIDFFRKTQVTLCFVLSLLSSKNQLEKFGHH